MAQEKVPWVDGDVGSLLCFMKGNLDFFAKSWWMLVHYKLSLSNRDN